MRLSVEIARTHLLAKPKQTIVAMMGVTFGIGIFIGMLSLMTGLNDFTEELAMTSTPDVRIFNDVTLERTSIADRINPEGINVVYHERPKNSTAKVRQAFQIASIIRQDSRVLGASPQLTSQVFYNFGPVQLNGTVSGVDILEEDRLFDIRSKMEEGQIEGLLTNANGLIMGAGLANKLKAKTGDRVVITTPQGFQLTLKIVGLFRMGLGAVDNVKSYANISTVQTILGKDKSFITDINVKLKDFHDAKQMAPGWQKTFGYKTEDWETANATFLLGVMIRNILTYTVSFTLLVVAGFGIYNILSMTIQNKMKDIAILKATGFAGRDVREIFMVQSLVIGFIGSLAGLAIGFIISYMISKAPFNGGDFISIKNFPVNFKLKYYLVGIVFGVATTAIAGFMPSRKASRVDPIEILRGQ